MQRGKGRRGVASVGRIGNIGPMSVGLLFLMKADEGRRKRGEGRERVECDVGGEGEGVAREDEREKSF